MRSTGIAMSFSAILAVREPPTIGNMNSPLVILPAVLKMVTLAVVMPQSPNMLGTLARLVLDNRDAVAARRAVGWFVARLGVRPGCCSHAAGSTDGSFSTSQSWP